VEDWTPIMDALAGSFRLTAFDRPGHGFSVDTGQYSHQANADAALGLIDALKLENAIVVGHSYGGSTALAVAARAPASVAAYVIVDSAAYRPSRDAGALYRLLSARWLGIGVVRVLGPLRAEQRIERGIAQLQGGRAPDPAFVELRTKLWTSPKVVHALAEEIVGAREGLLRLSSKYPDIRAPVYIVAQADDPFRRTTAERLHRDIAGSVLRLVPETGHYIQFDKPGAVVDAIREAASAR
jgi:pimeloyl-ACP methyl ester carboxylesterase